MDMTKKEKELVKQIQEILSIRPVPKEVQIARLLRQQGICEIDMPGIVRKTSADETMRLRIYQAYRDPEEKYYDIHESHCQ